MNKDDVLDLFRYNEWANDRLNSVVRKLPANVINRDLGGSHRSIRGVLSHIVSVEWVWHERWSGNNPSIMPDWVEADDVPRLIEKLATVEESRHAFLDRLSADDLRRTISFTLMSGAAGAHELGDLLVHVVNHSTYHRGQLASMLRQCDVAPLQTDFIAFRMATV